MDNNLVGSPKFLHIPAKSFSPQRGFGEQARASGATTGERSREIANVT